MICIASGVWANYVLIFFEEYENLDTFSVRSVQNYRFGDNANLDTYEEIQTDKNYWGFPPHVSNKLIMVLTWPKNHATHANSDIFLDIDFKEYLGVDGKAVINFTPVTVFHGGKQWKVTRENWQVVPSY